MGDFEFPTNIKQIGSIGDGLRIYMEDYVCSYLQQYAEAAGYEERLALLIGRDLIIDGQKVLFISGAVQGKYTEWEDGILHFTDQSWDYTQDQLDKYFSDMEIVGWMQSQPGYGVYLNPGYAQQHIKHFILPYQVLFVTDPLEKLNVFYIWDGDPKELVETKGYFVYYDKNKGMHDYMLDNKITKLTLATRDYMPENEEEARTRPSEPPFRIPAYDNPIQQELHSQRNRTPRSRRKNQAEQKRVMNMLVAMSAVLFVICFIMGAGLVQNDGRINSLEEQLTVLSLSYSSVLDQIRPDKAESVFAAKDSELSEQTMTSATEPPPQPAVIREDGNLVLAQSAAITPVPVTTPEPTPTPSPSPTPPTADSSPQPQAAAQSEPDKVLETYTVQQGDNLISISKRFYGTPDMVPKIMEVNQMNDPDLIYFGKVLLLP